MKTLTAILLFIPSLIPSVGWACTKDQAVDTIYKELLDKVGACRVLDVQDLQKDWLGYEYYKIKFSCVNDDYPYRTRKVYPDPKTGKCHLDI